MGVEEIIKSKTFHLNFIWKKLKPECITWWMDRSRWGEEGKKFQGEGRKKFFKKSVYRESGNLGAAALWDSVLGRKMD